MKRLHLFAIASSMSVALTGVLVACSSDDTIVTAQDGGPGPGKDGGDEETDANEPDAPPPPVDAGLTVDNYDDAVAEKLCDALTKCCYGDSEVPQDGGVDGGDAGSGFFDRASCLKIYSTLGFENANAGLAVARKGNVVVNQAKGVDCMAKIEALDCSLNGSSLKAVRSACFGALEGQLEVGDACTNSMECASGSFCNPDADAGAVDGGAVGHCTALRTQGQNCSIVDTGSAENDSNGAEIACSTRAGGDTGMACQSYDPNTSPYNYKSNRAEWTCQPAVANGKGCNSTVSCADGLCRPGVFECVAVREYFTEVVCKQHLR